MYYLAIIQNDSAQTIYQHQNLDDALAAYYSELAYRGEGRTKTVCVILNDEGTNIKLECWAKESEVSEPLFSVLKTQYPYICWRLAIDANASFSNQIVKPMIWNAEIKDSTFQPYAPTNRELYEMILALQNGGTT